ncbi:hypothetical protein DV737_g1064, partial [Chaetothyriales sp. CBS 132003]
MPETKLALDLASKRRRTRNDYFYQLSYRLRWSDNDMFGHVNNPYYGGLVDSIVNQYLVDEYGYGIQKHTSAAIIANTYCDYFGSLSYPDVIDVGLRVVKLGRTSVTYEVGFFRSGDDVVKAVGGSTHIWVEQKDGVLGRPLKEGMPDVMRKGYLRLMTKEEGARKPRELVKHRIFTLTYTCTGLTVHYERVLLYLYTQWSTSYLLAGISPNGLNGSSGLPAQWSH